MVALSLFVTATGWGRGEGGSKTEAQEAKG